MQRNNAKLLTVNRRCFHPQVLISNLLTILHTPVCSLPLTFSNNWQLSYNATLQPNHIQFHPQLQPRRLTEHPHLHWLLLCPLLTMWQATHLLGHLLELLVMLTLQMRMAWNLIWPYAHLFLCPWNCVLIQYQNIITEEGDDSDEEAEMTFAERRLMFERGLIPQAQVTNC